MTGGSAQGAGGSAQPEPAVGVEFFTAPIQVNHRRYEALRAFFVGGMTHAQAAAKFGYTRWAMVNLEPHQAAQDGDVRTCETRPSAQADTPGLNIAHPDSRDNATPR